MDDAKKFSLVKPTLETPFHVDFNWWEQQGRNWKVFLRDFLCPEHQTAFSESQDDALIDWVDPETAEVTQVDGIQQALISHCSLQADFFKNKALVDSVFLAFLTHNNKALTPRELEAITGYPAQRILLTVGGTTVQKGIRPFHA